MLHELGARPAAAIMARWLRTLGEPGVRRGPRPATAANPAGLTRRQAEVLELVAAGLSNAQIAARLALSGRTVDNHVAAILRKLGVRTRSEARAQAARLALPRVDTQPGAAVSNIPRPAGSSAWRAPGGVRTVSKGLEARQQDDLRTAWARALSGSPGRALAEDAIWRFSAINH